MTLLFRPLFPIPDYTLRILGARLLVLRTTVYSVIIASLGHTTGPRRVPSFLLLKKQVRPIALGQVLPLSTVLKIPPFVISSIHFAALTPVRVILLW